MNEKSLNSTLGAKFAIVMAALAVMFCMAFAPSQAYAAAGSSTEPDNIISVNGTTVDLDVVWAQYHSSTAQTTLGGLFVKDGAVNVVKTDKYVTLSELMEYLDESWASGDTMTFNVWGTSKTNGVVTGWTQPALYTKNDTFTYDNMMSTCTTFYDASSSAIDTNTILKSNQEAVIALSSVTVVIPAGSTASAVLASSSYPTVGYTTGTYSYDTPRLVWGYNPNVASQAGNRFPSNIDAITIQ